jgi:glycosyltransferase involved in cell wall biosynthesis
VTLVTYGGIPAPNLPAVTSLTVVDAAGESDQDFDARMFHGKFDPSSRAAFIRKSQELKTYHRAFSLIRREAFDVVQFLDADPVLLVLALHTMMKRSRAGQIAILANLHHAAGLKPGKNIRSRAYRKLFYAYALRRLIKEDLDALIVMDDLLKSYLLARFKLTGPAGNKVQVVPLGIDEVEDLSDKGGARRRLNLSQEETVFLLFGILEKGKRVDLAIEAIKERPSCRLLIAGKPDDYDEADVQELIHKHGCEKSVSAEIRYIEDGRMHDYFLASDAVLIPYPAAFKGQSGILAKACSHGKCVIASDAGALGKTVRESGIGLVVEPESADSLREAINKFLLLKPQDRMQMETNSRSLATAQSWNSVGSQLDDIYNEILNRKRGGDHDRL